MLGITPSCRGGTVDRDTVEKSGKCKLAYNPHREMKCRARHGREE